MAIGLDIVATACGLAGASGLVTAGAVVWAKVDFAGPRALGFVIGVLLGVVLLDVLPHLWESTGSAATVMWLTVCAALAAMLFDRLCDCGHAHAHGGGTEDGRNHRRTARKRGAELLLVGDFVHSAVDGVLIAAALAVGAVPGAVATIAVAIHEGPRRVAMVTMMLRAGHRVSTGLLMAACAGTGTLIGGVLAWWSAEAVRTALPVALAVSAAAMLCVALAQSVHLLRTHRRQRGLTIEYARPFLTGVVLAAGTHHLLEFVG